jgi:hypothetical protein
MRHRFPLVPCLAALACVAACSSPPEPTPEPAAATPAAGTPTAATPTAGTPTPAEPTAATKAPEPAATPATPTPVVATPTPAHAAPLRVVAVREGPVTILRQHDAPLVVLEGEPVPWVDGVLARHPNGSAGLSAALSEESDTIPTLAAFDGSADPLGAWASTMQEFMRSAAIYDVYQRTGDEWRRKDLRKGVLVAYYSAFVERDGALLALRNWAVDAKQDHYGEEDERPVASAFRGKVERALASAKPSWVRIAGAELAALPEIPAGMQLDGDVTTTDDGAILALAVARAKDGEDETKVVLRWPKGASEAERVEVPELAEADMLALGSSGEWAVVSGGLDREGGSRESYLAVGRGSEWQRVPVSLPGRAADASVDIMGAARAPDGELWIALGNRWQDGDRQPVWRKPAEGQWQPVPLPSLTGAAFGPAKSRVRDVGDEGRGWVEIERPQAAVEAERATSLVWAAGAVWIAVDVGGTYEGVSLAPSRTVVLTSLPGTAPVTVLPPVWQILLERDNHAQRTAQPGHEGCTHFSLVLGPAELATTKPEVVTAIGQVTASGQEDEGRIESIYTAEHDGAKVLVASAYAPSTKLAAVLRKGATKALDAAGVPASAVAADCRIPLLDVMVSEPHAAQ